MPRAFPAPTTADLPGTLMAARGLVEFPALLLVLERGGMLTPTLAVQAVRQAALVQRIGDRDRRTVALALLQGGVALIDRLLITGVVTPASASPLLSALMACRSTASRSPPASPPGWSTRSCRCCRAPTPASTARWSRRSRPAAAAVSGCLGGR